MHPRQSGVFHSHAHGLLRRSHAVRQADTIQDVVPFTGDTQVSMPGPQPGQALQYLERAMQVTTAKKATVLFKVEDERVSFR